MSLDAVKEQIAKDIQTNQVVVYMKGNKMAPMCGFSAQVVAIFNQVGVEFETKDVMIDPELRQAIKEFSEWPTFPQVFVNGELIGGCDITTELYQSGELQQLLNSKAS
jgi:monothiol glutaredoxin